MSRGPGFLFPKDHPYRQRLEEARASLWAEGLPGSPLIAALGLRETDSLHLAELHPQEFAALKAVAKDWGAHVHQTDGFDLALALTPPHPAPGADADRPLLRGEGGLRGRSTSWRGHSSQVERGPS